MSEGLLWGFKQSTESGLQPINELSELKVGDHTNSLIWLHFRSDTPETVEHLNALGISQDVIEVLCAEATRPRFIESSKGQVIFLRAINKNENADAEDMVSLRIWLYENIVITTRRKERGLLSTVKIKNQFEQGQGPEAPTELVCELVSTITQIIGEVVEELDDNLSECEEVADTGHSNQLEIVQIRRQCAKLRRFLAPQREALKDLYRNSKGFAEAEQIQLREQFDAMTRHVEELDLIKERALVLHDEQKQHIAEQQTTRLYVLSLVTAVFLPLSFLTGVFGMNVAGLPGLENPESFFYLMTGMGITAVVVLLLMRLSKWF